MPIAFVCPSCGADQLAGDHLAGRALRCQSCKQDLTVPFSIEYRPPPSEHRTLSDADTDADIFGQHTRRRRR